MRGTPLALQRALSRKLMPLAWALAAVVGVILALTWLALRAQVSLAGFLNGESVWSKAQKQAIIELDAYALSGSAEHYTNFQRDFDLLQSDRISRDAVRQPAYDKDQLARTYARGDMMPSARAGIIFTVRHLPWAPFVKPALADWRATDAPLHELGGIAEGLHAAYAAGIPSSTEIAHARTRIRSINNVIAPLSSNFSLEIAKGVEWFGNVLFMSVLAAACLACLLWLWMARRVLAGIRGSEERYRLLFDSAPDAIVMVDENSGRVVDANRTAGVWTGREPQELVGIDYRGLFEAGAAHKASSSAGELRSRDGTPRPVETQSSMVAWGEQVVRQAIIRDISERVESDRVRRIASEALASIAEGVIIADAQRRILSVNAAATQLTGFSEEKMVGRRLDATRIMADCGPLPATIWDEIATTHHWTGEVQSRRNDGSLYAEKLSISTIRDADQRVVHYVAVFSDVSLARANRHRLEHLAAHDALTGLVNRPEFQRHCEVAIESAALDHSAVAVLFIDLDAFKFVNDSYSHAVGDRLLKQVSERIRHQLRDCDIAGRIGGDEFTVLLSQLALREDAAAMAGRLLSTLSEPFHIDDYELAVSASIGIAGYPLDGEDAKTLIANADAAMYAAKSEERNTWRFYAPMMQANARHRMALATELRQALQDGEFRLAYQPSVEMGTGRIVAVEALLRWQHPDRGEVMPGEFIPVAESIGLIHRIDEWVMHAACAQVRAWDDTDMPRVRVAINVSARWFGHPGFVDSVRHALQTSAVSPARIVLEITEGAMLRLGEETESTMRALQALGIRVAIDDFGTGYASMAYLKLPAVAYLKIDRSFITGLPGDANDTAITTAMLAMAGSLGLTTIAEGVETEGQHEFLLRAGCVEGQGYLYSYPLPPAALEHMLRPKRQSGSARLKLVPPVRS
ncbi:MAG TPA: EAL domain-containing protein [Rhodanobacteraceae bacterium]|nr:EAL domain-containing protein [Rhodanobacteraceae bacterium]